MTNDIENIKISKKIEWENFPKKNNLTNLDKVKETAIAEINFLTDLLGNEKTCNLDTSSTTEIEKQKNQFLKEILNDYLLEIEKFYEKEFLNKEGQLPEKTINGKEHEKTDLDENKVDTLKTIIHNLRLFKIAESSINNALEEAMAEIYWEKKDQIFLLKRKFKNELLILTREFLKLRKTLNILWGTVLKYQDVLDSLGVEEEEMGEDIKKFFSQILGKKNLTGENTTLQDIKSIEGINNLQDLLDILNYFNEEYEREEYESQEMLKREEESSKDGVSIEDETEWKYIKDLSKENLIEHLKTEKEKVTDNSEMKSLITDVLVLLDEEKKSSPGNPTPEEKEKIGKIVAQIIIAKEKKVLVFLFKKLGEYGRESENSDECIKLIIEITRRCAGKLASLDNGSRTPRAPLTPFQSLPKASEKKTLIQMMKETKGKLKIAEILLGKPVNNYILGCLNPQGEELEEFKKKNWAQIIEEHEVFCQKQKEEIKQLRYIASVLVLTTIISLTSNLFLLIKKWYGGEKGKKVSTLDKKRELSLHN
jgi:hypothetical protein